MTLSERELQSDKYCFLLGKEAYLGGKTILDNPFLSETQDSFEWLAGFTLTRLEVVDEVID